MHSTRLNTQTHDFPRHMHVDSWGVHIGPLRSRMLMKSPRGSLRLYESRACSLLQSGACVAATARASRTGVRLRPTKMPQLAHFAVHLVLPSSLHPPVCPSVHVSTHPPVHLCVRLSA